MTAEQGEGYGVIPHALGELKNVRSTVPARLDPLLFDGEQWGPGSGVSDYGPRVNVYTCTQSGPAHDTAFVVDNEPVDDFAEWNDYGGVEAESFGHWVDLGAAGWRYHVTEPGRYHFIGQLQLTLNTTPHLSTRLRIALAGGMEDFYGQAEQRTYFGPAVASALAGAPGLTREFSQQAVDADVSYFYEEAFWRRGASETCSEVTWYFLAHQMSPGATSDTYAGL